MQTPSLNTLEIRLPGSGEQVSFNNVVNFVNSRTVLKTVTLTGGYNGVLSIGHDASPIEVLDVVSGGKGLRLAHINCPHLREIRMARCWVIAAGMWPVSTFSGNIFPKFEGSVDGSIGKRCKSTCAESRHAADCPDGNEEIKLWPRRAQSDEDAADLCIICIPVNSLPSGMHWGYPSIPGSYGRDVPFHRTHVDVPDTCVLLAGYDRWIP